MKDTLTFTVIILSLIAITLTVFCALKDLPTVDKGCEEVLCVS